MDAGITGHDMIIENAVSIIEVAEMRYAKVSRGPSKWVLAVPEAIKRRRVRNGPGCITTRPPYRPRHTSR